MSQRGRPKQQNLKPETLKRYERAARAGNQRANERLSEMGVSISPKRKSGRPSKQFHELALSTRKRISNRIIASIKELKSINRPLYELDQKYYKSNPAVIRANLEDKVFGDSASDLVYQEYRRFNKKRGIAIEERINEIREEMLDENIYTENLTQEEVREFYESKDYVRLDKNENNSDGLQKYYQENNIILSDQRLSDFILRVLIPRYPKDSPDGIRVRKIYEDLISKKIFYTEKEMEYFKEEGKLIGEDKDESF